MRGGKGPVKNAKDRYDVERYLLEKMGPYYSARERQYCDDNALYTVHYRSYTLLRPQIGGSPLGFRLLLRDRGG
ncbi:hypothetical protein Trydic_g121 [Trypoxylus dichotomus]